MLLYRPVGPEELKLVYEADMRAFPPRLPDQPIFYPVTNEGYAAQIAKDWNTKSGTLAGFVTRFEVDDEYVGKFERRVVGAREHEELWVPAEELDEFNRRILRPIEVTAAYFGDEFHGYIPAAFGLKGKDAKAQFLALAGTFAYSLFDFSLEVAANHVAVFLGFYLWEQSDFTADDFDQAKRDDVLRALRTRWSTTSRSAVPLGIARQLPGVPCQEADADPTQWVRPEIFHRKGGRTEVF